MPSRSDFQFHHVPRFQIAVHISAQFRMQPVPTVPEPITSPGKSSQSREARSIIRANSSKAILHFPMKPLCR